MREWRKKNRKAHKKYMRERYERIKQGYVPRVKEVYVPDDSGRAKAYRKYRRKYLRQRRKEARYRIDTRMGSNLSDALRGKRGKKGYRRWEDLVGYTIDDLIRHLEGGFDDKMSWDNYGKWGWHIDHIKPKSWFEYERPEDEEFKRCWALDNLQPLWAKENLRKYNKWIG